MSVNADPVCPSFVGALGRSLIDSGFLEEQAFARAKRAQSKSGERIDLVLTRLGLVSEIDLVGALARQLSLPVAGLADIPPTPLFPDKFDEQFLRRNKILPLADTGQRFRVAVADPFDRQATEAMAYLLGRPVERYIIAPTDFEKAVRALYGSSPAATVPEGTASQRDGDESGSDVQRLKDIASEAPIIQLVNRFISEAVDQNASDIHIEPQEDQLRVRYRVDGALYIADVQPLSTHAAITSRVKIIANLNIAERRLPQDGRAKLAVRGRDVDLRVSTTPTLFGESVVLRILDRSSVNLSFSGLGFSQSVMVGIEDLLRQPNGIILVTGPTGSGKTTTLYTALLALNSHERKIFSVEDPVEYQLTGVNQLQVLPRIGLNFATALRSILRQDPDIIMIGEIRDLETAQIAIQSSLTGHLVLSTLHTNSAAATLTRLLDMGVEDYLLGATVTGILAQRLVRRLCTSCAEPCRDAGGLVRSLVGSGSGVELPDHANVLQARGCAACRDTGYSGRACIAELLVIDDTIRRMIMDAAPQREVERYASASGFRTMREDGAAKVCAGRTTMEEVLRVTRST